MLPLEGSAGYEEKTTGTNTGSSEVEYNEDNIRHLDDMEHIRVRSGMYIGRLGDGSQNDDGIYVLLKEVMDNSIDEFKMGAGKRIEVNIEENLRVSVRDYGRGIPQGKLVEAVSKLNTGGKYDSKGIQKERWSERCRHQGGQRTQQPFRGTQLPRRQSTHGYFRERRTAKRPDRGQCGRKRYVYLL